ncbi:MAG TPA: hypothetical protein VFH63_08625 [candidate division Zixibacteria bacterium]|nr:hypothetical protein [candidate division Zixibacteria bacterium]
MHVLTSRRLRRNAHRLRIAGVLLLLVGVALAFAFRGAVLAPPPDPAGVAAVAPPDILAWFIVGCSMSGVGLLMLIAGVATRDRPL